MTDQVTTPPPPAPTPEAARGTARPRPLRDWVASWNWSASPPGWSVANLTLLLVWTTWAGHRLDLPPAAALIVGGIGAAAAVGAVLIAEQGLALILWRLACWILPALWATAALHWSPFQPYVLGVGIGLALAAYLIAAAIHRARRTAEQAALAKAGRGVGLTAEMLQLASADQIWKAEDPAKTDEVALAANWRMRIRRVCSIKGAEVVGVGLWSQGTGYTLTLRLPLGGFSWRDLADYADRLAEDARLPADCGITIKGTKRRGIAEMLVVHRNVMSETHLAPRDYSPASIYDKAPIGFLPDGIIIKLALKWVWMCLIGQTDSGKSSMLHLVNTYLVRCVDALVWHIDIGGGGGISRPWVAPWHEGRAARPAVDWAATTVEEAELMCRAAIAIIEGRKRHYADQLDNGKVRCSPEVPHIVVVSDETANLPERIKGLLTQANQTGRAAGVRGITCALRGTADDLPTAIRKHSRVRIGMRVSDADEIRYLFDRPGKVDPALADDQGSGWIEHQEEDTDGKSIGQKYLTPFKAFFMPDTQIDEAAIAVAPLRPDLDAPSVALADSVSRSVRAYSDRWERTIPQLFVVDQAPAVAPVPVDPQRAAKIAAAEADQQRRHAEGGSIDERLARLNELGAQIAHGAPSDGVAGVDPGTVAELTEGLPSDNLLAVLGVVDRAGSEGIGPADILSAVNGARDEDDHITDKTIQRKLTELVERGFVIKPDRGVYISAIHIDQGEQHE